MSTGRFVWFKWTLKPANDFKVKKKRTPEFPCWCAFLFLYHYLKSRNKSYMIMIMKIKNQRVNALTADQGTSVSTSFPIWRWNTWRCHRKTNPRPHQHSSQTLLVANRRLDARNHLARATINQTEAAGILCTAATQAPPGASGREQDPGFMGQKMLTSFNYQSQQRGGSLTKARDCGEKSRFLGGSVLPLWARNLSASSSSSRRVRSGFYKIWQSVSQCGALSRVKYLDVLPSNSQNGCLVSSVEFLTSLGVTPSVPFQ